MNCKKCKAKLKIGSMICPECGADNTPTNCRKCHAMLKKGSTVCPKCGKNNAAIQPWMKIVAVIVALALLAALGYGLVRLCNPRENNIFYK